MYNARYHIASLVAVFLALALGLVLGGLVVRQGTFDNQQQALVRGLRSEFKSLSTENRTLKERDELYTGFSALMTDAWVNGRLTGKTFIVLSNAGRAGGLTAVTEAIEAAGGNVAVVTLQEPGLGVSEKAVQDAVPGLPDGEDEQIRSLAASLAAEWTAPQQDRPLSVALVNAKAISVEGLAPGTAVAGVVDLAVLGGKPDEAVLAILDAFSVRALPAVAAQVPSSRADLAKAAADRDIAALDSLGLEPGRYTLVALLSGARRGYYGVGDEVDAAYPAMPGAITTGQ